MSTTFKEVDKSEKVSSSIVAQIRDAILSGKIKPGDKLDYEKELSEKFGVSKATMREALRILEVLGLVEIRKGISGGAYVAEVEMKTTIHSIMNFLHFQHISIKEITMVRYFLEPSIARIAASKITQEDIQNLKKYVNGDITYDAAELSREASFHSYLARIAENPILSLLLDLVDNLLVSLKIHLPLNYDFYQHVRKAHETILECLIQRDSEAAGIAISDDLLEVGRYVANLTKTPAFDPSEIEYNASIYTLYNNFRSHVVHEENLFQFQEQKAIFRRVGTSRLYVVLNKEDKDKA